MLVLIALFYFLGAINAAASPYYNLLVNDYGQHNPISDDLTQLDHILRPEKPSIVKEESVKDDEVYTTVVRKTTKRCNYGKGRIMEFGLLENGEVVPIITICLHPSGRKAFWTKHSLVKTSHCDTEKFRSRILNLKKYYDDLDSDYDIDLLSPPCDFTKFKEQALAFNFLNTVPIYKGLNGNWHSMVRFFREVRRSEVREPITIITGSFPESPHRVVSYPQFLFKIAVASDASVAYVAVNGNRTVDPSTVCKWRKGAGWNNNNEGQIFDCSLDDKLKRLLGVEDEDLQC